MNQLGAIDASFLYVETAQTPLHAGSLCILEPLAGGGSFHDAFRAHLAQRLHLAPVLGRTFPPETPDAMERPGWVDAGQVDLDHHVRRVELPRPGNRRQLEELVARLHSNPLDRERPLWEFHVVEGLEGGRAAVYAKLHHAVLDADAGAQLTEALFDAGAEPREVAPPPAAPLPAAAEEAPPAAPSFLDFLGSAQSNLLRQQMRALAAIPDAWQAWTRALMPGGGSSSQEAAPDAGAGHPAAPRTPLNGTVTSQRSYAARSLPLADAEAVARDADVRLDDVVLAACGAALRRWLLDRRALPDQPLVALVPLAPGDAAARGVEAAAPALLVALATDVDDPLQRLHAIAGAARAGAGAGAGADPGAGADADAGAGAGAGSGAGTPGRGDAANDPGGAVAAPDAPRGFSFIGASPLLQGARIRPGRAEPAPLAANAAVCTLPGPAAPLHLAGARMVAVHPVSIPTHGLAVSIAAQCYGDDLDLGLTACRHVLPDPALLADHLLDGFAELKRAVGAARPAGDAKARGEDAPAAAAAPVEAAAERPRGDAADAAPGDAGATPRSEAAAASRDDDAAAVPAGAGATAPGNAAATAQGDADADADARPEGDAASRRADAPARQDGTGAGAHEAAQARAGDDAGSSPDAVPALQDDPAAGGRAGGRATKGGRGKPRAGTGQAAARGGSKARAAGSRETDAGAQAGASTDASGDADADGDVAAGTRAGGRGDVDAGGGTKGGARTRAGHDAGAGTKSAAGTTSRAARGGKAAAPAPAAEDAAGRAAEAPSATASAAADGAPSDPAPAPAKTRPRGRATAKKTADADTASAAGAKSSRRDAAAADAAGDEPARSARAAKKGRKATAADRPAEPAAGRKTPRPKRAADAGAASRPAADAAAAAGDDPAAKAAEGRRGRAAKSAAGPRPARRGKPPADAGGKEEEAPARARRTRD